MLAAAGCQHDRVAAERLSVRPPATVSLAWGRFRLIVYGQPEGHALEVFDSGAAVSR
jgi:hypothetical protein